MHDGDLLEPWAEHFASLATPSQDPNFDDDFKLQVKDDVKAIASSARESPQHILITNYDVSHTTAQFIFKAKDEEGLVAENFKLGRSSLVIFIIQLINRII